MIKRRNYGWSQRGTKSSRAKQRKQQRRSRIYCVAVGRRPGIYDLWDDAYKQVHGYSGAVHKSFKKLEEAYHWMYYNRVTPPAVLTIWPWLRQTPHPCQAYEEGYLAYWDKHEDSLQDG